MARSADIDINAGARLDRLPICGFHWRIMALIGAGMFLDAFDIYLAGGVLGAVLKEGWSTLELNAAFVSATFVGMTIGAWCSGILGDRFGRRFSYQMNLAIFGLASIAAAFAPNMIVLIGLRFIIGIGLGAEIVVGYATLTEFVPASSRGRWIGLLAVITNFSLFVSSMVGLWVIPTLGWRYMFGLVGCLAMVVWILRKSMPESPRWLAANGRADEAEKILSAIEVEAARKATLPAVAARAPVQESPGAVWRLFQPPYLARTLLGSLLHIVVGFSLYGFIGWLPTFMVKGGHSVVSSLGYTTVMALGGPVGSLIGLVLADRLGRRLSIVCSSIAAAALGIAYPYMPDGVALAGVGFLLITAIYVMLATGFAMHVPELFPTRYRLRGTAICATSGRIATALVQYVVVAIFAWQGLTGVLTTLAGILVFQAVVFLVFGFETKGRSLEDASAVTDAEAARQSPMARRPADLGA
ncbi:MULTISPECIES: MFS transporter [unclassified Bradyrhizobium]|uniref:MFS transporter n=1 Tax=Bradyrhizobium sp. USDA 4541 TaxID=2817704 RepID=UPI00209CA4E3|nr:MFS transporter [Bradyrhizobium sp. USDA 4541]MCP1847277.1 putative MFS transporter [Bradyrhizobium sp. USDA 4541]MCP1911180.1 putative MFS transporter [Bradyrhizobium elkanii]